MTKAPELKVYHVPGSRSLRVTWLLEELRLPYEVDPLEFEPGNVGGKAYAKIHPLQKIPALEDGDTLMFESVAIMQYIMNKYGDGGLRPNIDDPDYGAYLQWLHYGEASLAPILVDLMYQRTFFKPEERSEIVDAHAEQRLRKQMVFLEMQLGSHDYILERGFTAADISIGYCLLLVKLAKSDHVMTDRVREYRDVLMDRDGWTRGTKRVFEKA